MTKENMMDIATDILKERIGDANLVIEKMYKGTNPYRMEPMPDEERINNYLKIKADPQMEMQMRQEFGNKEFDNMEFQVRDLINRRMRNA